MLATWGCTTFPKPTLSLDFLGATSLDSGITFSRGSQATLFDSTGTLIFAPSNTIRNSAGVGAVAGSPGTLPTNWNVGSAAGLTTNVIGTGTEAGVNYVDIQFVGTPTGTAYTLFFESTTQIAALNAQTWASSLWCKIAAGATTNITSINNNFSIRDSGGASLASYRTAMSVSSTWTRYAQAQTISNASTAYVQPGVWFTVTVGAAIDITLRIGVPQLQRGSVATEAVATTGTAYFAPRFDYNPSTLQPRGLLIEEQRTNSIRNNTGVGAVAGTPGTLPTNWARFGNGAGLTWDVAGSGTENGIAYVDLRLSGTSTTTVQPLLRADQVYPAASVGQAWTYSNYIRVVAGSLTGITNVELFITEWTSGGAFVRQSSQIVSASAATMVSSRQSITSTISGATTGLAGSQIGVTPQIGVAIDVTLRIGLPQLEQGAFATSVIPTTTTALTRNADVASMTGTNFSSWYSASEGTFYSESQLTRQSSAGGTGIVESTDGSANNVMRVFYRASGATGVNVFTSGSLIVDLTPTGVITANQTFKDAFAYKVNDFAASGNGAAVVTDTSGTVPVVDQLNIGRIVGLATLNGYVRRLAFYPTRLPNTTLQALTA